MMHAFNLMSTVCGHLNIIANDYSANRTSRTIPTPRFVYSSFMLNCNREMNKQDTSKLKIKKTIRTGTGDYLFPIYINIVENLDIIMIDKSSVIATTNSKGNKITGIATILFIPEGIFNLYDSNTTVKLLKDLYFKLLATDKYMTFNPSITLLKEFKNPKINIPSYDIEMMLITLCCININIRALFVVNGNVPDPNYLLSFFSDKELPDSIKNKLENVLFNCSKTSEIRDAIEDGLLLEYFCG